jgi:hypothetical protein
VLTETAEVKTIPSKAQNLISLLFAHLQLVVLL